MGLEMYSTIVSESTFSLTKGVSRKVLPFFPHKRITPLPRAKTRNLTVVPGMTQVSFPKMVLPIAGSAQYVGRYKSFQ